ncbi:MAG: hypothetical protein QM692_19165 [Thermomicrobiales bacterium]
MPDSSISSILLTPERFDEMCHDIRNPLMIIRGRAQLTERLSRRLPDLTETERRRLLTNLAAIEMAVVAIVEVMDGWGESLDAGDAGQAPQG